MYEIVKIWLEELYKKEIEKTQRAIRNEHAWELGYGGGEPINPHTKNIEILREYIKVLEKKISELDGE